MSAAHLAENNRDNGIAVLIVDDSAVARAALARIVSEHDGLRLAGLATGALQAIEWLRSHSVDVILLDLDMPGQGGLDALPELVRVGAGAQILIVSSAAEAGAAATIQALASGAADTLAKPAAGGIGQQFGALLAERVLRLGRAAARSPGPCLVGLREVATTPVSALALGASTGGIAALGQFFGNLGPGFAAPIFVTQHLPTSFMPYFADQLARYSARRVYLAANDLLVRSGDVVLARGDAHLEVVAHEGGALRCRLSTAETPTRNRPSVDRMFTSLGAAVGAGGVGVVLSGMGRDGCEGAGCLIAAGGSVMIQDFATSAIWGMPGAVAKAGHASVMGSPAALAAHLVSRGAR